MKKQLLLQGQRNRIKPTDIEEFYANNGHIQYAKTKKCQLLWWDEFNVSLYNGIFLKDFVNLKKLYLNCCRIYNLENFTELKDLEELCLNNNRLTSLEGLENCKKLKRLYIDCNKTILCIRGITNLTSLEMICLSYTSIVGVNKDVEDFFKDNKIYTVDNNIKLFGMDLFKRTSVFNPFMPFQDYN